ncbi:hypothetical protein HPL003_06670 [Paenibacillus terrae HPL-003]|uniref:Uncharacterized protein n=1 Tax=Paenibacillus terrae (strain HPL-003) TaxID=985665 RepID=G7W3L0_PAETH|nr:hypothetical protein HPL003_06670 [Paenibacillus terrae HPL-003]
MNHFSEEEMPATQEKIRLPRDWGNMLRILDEVVRHERSEGQQEKRYIKRK